MSDEEIVAALTRAGLERDREPGEGTPYFNDYGWSALRIAYLAGLADGARGVQS